MWISTPYTSNGWGTFWECDYLDMNDPEHSHDIEVKLEKWRKPMQWAVAFLLLMIAYFFAYPALIVFLENQTEVFDNMPDSLLNPLEYSVLPIVWLMEEVALYEAYFEWLEVIFPS